MCFVLLTINLCCFFFVVVLFFLFFHEYSLNCMAPFFLSLLMMIFFHKYSLKCMTLFLDIHVVFTGNEMTLKRLNQSRASNCILCHLYRFLSSWTSSILGHIGQHALFFRALERRIL